MKVFTPLAKWSTLTGLILLCLAGCGNKNGTSEVQLPSANQVTKSVENAASTIKKEAGPAVAKGVHTIDKVTKPAVAVAEAAVMTGKVKAAIMANQTVDSSKINVDVKGNEVILRGRVKNAQEKLLVQKIAKQQALNYKIVNQLQIEGATHKP